jgi:hypothetical protein
VGGEGRRESSITQSLSLSSCVQRGIVYLDAENWGRTTTFGVAVISMFKMSFGLSIKHPCGFVSRTTGYRR